MSKNNSKPQRSKRARSYERSCVGVVTGKKHPSHMKRSHCNRYKRKEVTNVLEDGIYHKKQDILACLVQAQRFKSCEHLYSKIVIDDVYAVVMKNGVVRLYCEHCWGNALTTEQYKNLHHENRKLINTLIKEY